MASSRRAPIWTLALVIGCTAAAGAAASAGDTAAVAVISIPGPIAIRIWQPATDNLVPVTGRVTIDGAPVAGVLLRVGDYELPTPTGPDGEFSYLADDTILGRYVVSVANDSQARAHGVALSAALKRTLASEHASIAIAYPVSGLRVGLDDKGDPTVTGRITLGGAATAPPTVALYSYQLTGTVTDASGRTVSGAIVSTRTNDRNYWTISTPTDRRGRYSSLFTASDESGDNPVPMNVEVAIGNVVYSFLPLESVSFPALRSARLDVRLPPNGYAMAPPVPQSYPGAIYQGTVVGVSSGQNATAQPLSETWPDSSGRFTITLPHALAGHTVSLWEAELQLFSATQAAPGSPIELANWPPTLPHDAALTGTTIRLP